MFIPKSFKETDNDVIKALIEVRAQFKLSQNKSEADRQGVIAGLSGLNTSGAKAMSNNIAHPK